MSGTALPGKGIQGHVSDDFAPFSDTGIYGTPPWYGTATVQLSLMALFAVVFFSATLGFTSNSLLSRAKHDRIVAAPLAARRARLLAMVTSALNVIVLVGVLAVIVELLSNGGEEIHIPGLFQMLPVLSLLATLLTIGMAGCAMLAWKRHYWSLVGRMYYSLVVLVALLFVPFLSYWDLLTFSL